MIWWLAGQQDGLDQAVHAHRLRGQGDHAVGGQHTQGLIDGQPVRVTRSAENGAGDIVRGVAGQDMQQADGGRVPGGDRLDGDVPDPGDHLLPRPGPGGVHGRGMLAEPPQVPGRGDAGLGYVGGGLVQRQRQVSQLRRDQGRNFPPGRGPAAGPGRDQVRGRAGIQDLQADRAGDLVPAGVAAGGDHDVPAGQLPQQRPGILRVIDVIQDQQPPRVRLQPPGRPRGGLGRGPRRGHRAAQPLGQGRQPGLDLLAILGGDPPDQRILSPARRGMVQGQLGLAHAAQPVHRLDHHRPGIPGQRPAQLPERAVPAHEHPRRGPRQVMRPRQRLHLAGRGNPPARPPGVRPGFLQRMQQLQLQLLRAGHRRYHDPRPGQPVPERPLPRLQLRVGIQQRRGRDRQRRVLVQQEHQPDQPGVGGGLELQLGIGHLRPVPHR